MPIVYCEVNHQVEQPGFKRLTLPLDADALNSLHAGDCILLSGVVYTARDAAHRRLHRCIEEGTPLPVDPKGMTVYYAGPAPASPGYVIGPAGPTSSYRMDPYTPELIRLGMNCMIGKGRRSPEVIAAMKECGAVYLGAVGGAAALISRQITSCSTVAYEDLGTEAIRRLEVSDLPLIVLIDRYGRNIYEEGPKAYALSRE